MFQQPYPQNELSSGVYTATLRDESGALVTALDTLEVWLRDVRTNTIINSRDGQSLLNTNGGTFSAGVFTWAMTPKDHVIIGRRTVERHEAVFMATWDFKARSRTWNVEWEVMNFKPLPAVGSAGLAAGTSTASAVAA
jgi:hypothetical protein